jgi:regulator of protease activity HflC (stomatin/prohibitin superfamily)
VAALIAVVIVIAVLALIFLAMSLRVVQQYEEGVLFRLGKVRGVRKPGLARIIPIIDVLHRVSLRIVTMPIQSQGIITRDNVNVNVSAEKRAKIIAAEGEPLAAAALGQASDTMMAHPLALQLRNLQTLVEIGVDKNTTVVFPAPLMCTIQELGAFLAPEKSAVTGATPSAALLAEPNGASVAARGDSPRP